MAEEFFGGSAAELATETNLLRGPQEDAEIIGRLPKGTLLSMLGEVSGNWVKIEVELVNGIEQGWIDERAIKSNVIEDNKEDNESKKSKKVSSKKEKSLNKKRRIPEDEMAVLKRESSFVYGIYGGGNYGILSSSYEEALFQGMGLQGGGFINFFLNRELTLGLEVGGTQLSGSQNTVEANLVKSGTARLVDIAGVFEYLYRDFRFFGALQYSLGVGIADFPIDEPPSASDFSGVWLKVGAGYAIEISQMVNLVLKGFYGFSFNRTYIGFHDFGLSAYLEFRG